MKIFINTSKGGRIRTGWYLYVLEFIKEDKSVVSRSNLDRMKPVENTTEARLTLMALIEAVSRIKVDEYVDVDINVGNHGIYQAFNNHWYDRWVKREFDDIKNADLWRAYREEVNRHPKCAFRLINPDEFNTYSSWMHFTIRQKEERGKCR